MYAWEYAQQLICKQTFGFVLFLFCKQTAEEQRLHLRSSMYDVAFLIWFTAFVCFVFWTVEFCQFLHDFFLFIIVIELYLHTIKSCIITGCWYCYVFLVFTKCNGRDFFTKGKLDWQGIFLEKLIFSNQPNDNKHIFIWSSSIKSFWN